MNAKILEIFKSIQGEGKYAGINQVFVRFFECNMHCQWCDTPHSIGDTTRNFKTIDAPELLEKIEELREGCSSISLTGGEPLLQADFIKTILPQLKRMELSPYLETNGILPEELEKVIDQVDVIAMDIKLPSSTKAGSFWAEHRDFLKIAARKDLFIKTVITSDTTDADIVKAVDLVAELDPNILFILQPNTYELKNGVMKRTLDLQEICLKRLNQVRVLPQIHKFMKLR